MIHQISAADIPAQPTSTLDLAVKNENGGSGGDDSNQGVIFGVVGGVLGVFTIIAIAFWVKFRF
jgi:hypothetical protein